MLSASSQRNWLVFLTVFFVSGGVMILWLDAMGTTDDSTRLAIRHSGQVMFVIYMFVFLARPLQQLLRKPWTAKILKNRRLIGVALTGLMTAHLLMIVTRSSVSSEFAFPQPEDVFGGSAYLLLYLMFITSFNEPARALGPRAWKLLHRTGLIVIGIAFVAPKTVAELSDPHFWAFAAPFLLAVLVRFIAWRRLPRQGS